MYCFFPVLIYIPRVYVISLKGLYIADGFDIFILTLYCFFPVLIYIPRVYVISLKGLYIADGFDIFILTFPSYKLNNRGYRIFPEKI